VLRLLREGPLLRTAVGAATLNGTYHSLLFLLTFHLQERLHWSPWQNALALLPACLPLAVTVPFAGRMTARYGTARLITLGAAAPLVGYALLLARPAPTSYVTGILPTLLLVGAGFVLSFAALNLRAASSAADEDRPAAVRAYQAAVQLGAVPMLPLTAWLLGTGHGQRPALALITAVAAVGLTAALSTASASDGKAPA
jgi:MFS family permease